MLTTKFTPTSLPNSQNSIHPVRVVNGQTATIAKTFPMAQLTSIVIAAPGTRLAGPQTVQISKPNVEKQVQIRVSANATYWVLLYFSGLEMTTTMEKFSVGAEVIHVPTTVQIME